MRVVLGTFRYWPAIAIAATLATIAAFVAPKIVKPVYESTTVLLHRELISTSSVLGVQGYQGESNLQRNTRLREMLLSRSTLQKIVEDLKLYPETVASRGVIEAVEQMRADTECKVGSANTFSIRYGGYDPEVVYQVIQRLSETLIAQSTHYRREQAESTRDFLEAQHKGTRKELAASEQSLAKFLADNPEFAFDLTAAGSYAPGASLRASQPKVGAPSLPKGPEKVLDRTTLALERQAERLRRQLKADEDLKAGAKPRPAPQPRAPKVDPAKQQAVDEAKGDVARAEASLASALATYTPKHPDAMAAQSRLNAARAKLRAAQQAATASVADPTPIPVAPATKPLSDQERAALNKRLALVNEKISAALKADGTGEVVPIPVVRDDVGERIVALETQWAAVNRELDAIRERDQRLQRQLFEASIVAKVEASGNASQMVVIDESFKPERPARRGPRRTSAIAAALLLLLGVSIALLLSILDDRPQDEVDLRRMNLGPIAQTLPLHKMRVARGAQAGAHSSAPPAAHPAGQSLPPAQGHPTAQSHPPPAQNHPHGHRPAQGHTAATQGRSDG